MSFAGERYSADSAWWQFERLQYAIERDYPRYMALWRSLADKIEKSLYVQVQQNGAPNDTTVAENTRQLLMAVNKMYTNITEQSETFVDQHFDMNEKAKKRANIIF